MKTSQRAQELLNYTKPEQTYLRALLVFAAQNPGFEWANYATPDYKRSLAAYRGDSRPVQKQLKEIRNLAWRYPNLSNEVLKEASNSAFSGRLQFVESDKGVAVDYCTGQYWPTEYRLAALQVIKRALQIVDWQFEQQQKQAALA